ncbi:MAG: hypothetical protein WCR52_23770 [Bacteroidota bacterium]
MEDIKQYLSDNASEPERAAAEQVRQGLTGLRLEAKVAAVAVERRALLRRRFFNRLAIWAALVLLVGAAFWFWVKKETPAQIAPTGIEQQVPEQHAPVQGSPVPERKPETPTQEPIAERPRSPREIAAQPLVRSVQPELDSATNRLINTLLKKTPANYTSKPLNDAFKLLQKNKPALAKAMIFKLGVSDRDGQWLLAIALLEEDKADEALVLFEKMAKDPDNPNMKEAQMAVEALQ